MARAIKSPIQPDLVLKDGDRLVYDYPGMIGVLQEAWGAYWNEDSAPANGRWEQQHLREPQPLEPLQPISGDLIREQLRQSSRSSPGPDSWRFEELAALPAEAHDQLAELYGLMETTSKFPLVLTRAWVAMITDKHGPQPPLKMRPISVMSSLYRLYGKCRLALLQPWLARRLPEEISSYVAGRDFRKDAATLAAEVEKRALQGERPIYVLSLDASKAFPSSSRTRMWAILQNEGLSRQLTDLFEWGYTHGQAVLRLCGRFAGSSPFALKRGIHQGCPFSVMSFLGLQLPALRLVARDCVGVRVLVYADDVTLYSENKRELEKAANLLHAYYADGSIEINAAKTQFLSSDGKQVMIQMAGQDVRSTHSIKVLGVVMRDALADDSNERTKEVMDKMATSAIRLEGLPANAKAKEAAWAGIISPGLWWCPWATLVKGSHLTQARMLLLRAIKPGLTKGPRLAGIATCFLMKGHRIDPVMITIWQSIRWLQLLPGNLQHWVEQVPEGEFTPIGPISTLRYYCAQLNIRLHGGWASNGRDAYVELRQPVGEKAKWEHDWRHLLRVSLVRVWAYRREFHTWAEENPDFERTLTYYRKQDDPIVRNALEILFTGGMLTNARLHRSDGGFRGCTCGGALDTELHRFWSCGHTATWRAGLGLRQDDLPIATQQTGWILESSTLSETQIARLHEYMAKVVRFFWNLGKRGEENAPDEGGDGDEANALRGSGMGWGEGPAPGGTSSLADTRADNNSKGSGKGGRDETRQQKHTRRGNCRTVALPGHIVVENTRYGSAAEIVRLTCKCCGARGSDKNRTRFVGTHSGCTPEQPLQTRKKRCLTRAERDELQRVAGVDWRTSAQRAKRLMVDAFER